MLPLRRLCYLLFLAVERTASSSQPLSTTTCGHGVRPSPLCYQFENDLKVMRKVIGWQSPGYDSKMQHEMLSLAHPGDFIYFSSYALAGLMPPLSSFFLVLLEHYRLQFRHLSPHSIMLVAIFTHFCNMFVRVRPSVRLFRRFHMLCPVNKQPPHLGGYYFQQWTKSPSKYITALSPGRWERWRGGLGDGANRCPRAVDVADRYANDPPPPTSTGSRTSAWSRFSTLCWGGSGS
jgi:hypothetical protein